MNEALDPWVQAGGGGVMEDEGDVYEAARRNDVAALRRLLDNECSWMGTEWGWVDP